MQEFIDKLVDKVGLDRAQAEKVVAFLREHADEVPALLARSGIAEKLPGGLGAKLGGLF